MRFDKPYASTTLNQWYVRAAMVPLASPSDTKGCSDVLSSLFSWRQDRPFGRCRTAKFLRIGRGFLTFVGAAVTLMHPLRHHPIRSIDFLVVIPSRH
mmetsp:Transcript_32453/g.74335  ORF Transcript_32453/g.74335 Transcript_32453/m.74335 type:complete len:97 (-) Transcript_32453:265-555(-)